MNYRHVLCLAGTLMLFGFGCKPGWNDPYYRFHQTAASKKALTKSDLELLRKDRETGLQNIQQALQRLTEATSFRASVSFPSTNGSITGVLAFSRDHGIHGTLQAPGPIVTEIYSVGDKILFKTNNTDWLDVSGTPEGKNTQNQLTSAFIFKTDREQLIADASQIQDIAVDRSGCTLFTFQSSGETPQIISLCVKDGYPTYVMTLDDNGKPTEIRYWDFNRSIDFTLPEAYKVTTTSTAPTTSTSTK